MESWRRFAAGLETVLRSLMSWLDGARTRLGLVFGRRAAESRMDREFRFHLDMETERLVREAGLDRAEARRRALVAFGGAEQHRETLRAGRGLAWLGGLSLDFRLGFRMLVKYPGLTVVGGLAMAFGIWVGAVTFEVVTLVTHPDPSAARRRSHRPAPELGRRRRAAPSRGRCTTSWSGARR